MSGGAGDGFEIHPSSMHEGAGHLAKFGQALQKGGTSLENSGQNLLNHVSQDSSGIGATIEKFAGHGLKTGGKLFTTAGGWAERASGHLHGSATAHEENEHNTTQTFRGISPDDKTPHVHGGGESGQPRPTRGGSGSGSGVHKPPTPSDAGGQHGDDRNLGPSWREEWNQRSTPKERQELAHAMRKLSEEPNDRGVAGSGRLTQHERELMARAQKNVKIDENTPMQKVISPEAHDRYLNPERNPDGTPKKTPMIGGFVGRQQDATHLNTPDKIIQGTRLDYAGSPYHQGMPKVHAVEFPAGNPKQYHTPLGAPVSADHGALATDPSVRHASDQMNDAAHSVGLDKDSYVRQNNDWPYSGAGVTADPNGIPERVKDWHEIPDGSKMVEYDQSGNRTVTHEYDSATHEWIPIS